MAKEKTIELKARKEKISEEHLKELQGILNLNNNIQFNIGKLEGQKHNLLHELGMQQKKIADIQDMLEREYGTFDVNVNDGTINWKEDEK